MNGGLDWSQSCLDHPAVVSGASLSVRTPCCPMHTSLNLCVLWLAAGMLMGPALVKPPSQDLVGLQERLPFNGAKSILWSGSVLGCLVFVLMVAHLCCIEWVLWLLASCCTFGQCPPGSPQFEVRHWYWHLQKNVWSGTVVLGLVHWAVVVYDWPLLPTVKLLLMSGSACGGSLCERGT